MFSLNVLFYDFMIPQCCFIKSSNVINLFI